MHAKLALNLPCEHHERAPTYAGFSTKKMNKHEAVRRTATDEGIRESATTLHQVPHRFRHHHRGRVCARAEKTARAEAALSSEARFGHDGTPPIGKADRARDREAAHQRERSSL